MFDLNMKYLQKIVQLIIRLGPSWQLSNKRVVWRRTNSTVTPSALLQVSRTDVRGGGVDDQAGDEGAAST